MALSWANKNPPSGSLYHLGVSNQHGANKGRGIMKNIVMFSVFLTFLFTNLYAASVKEDYELQEKCGKRAEEVFKKEVGGYVQKNGNGNLTFTNYNNHYNKTLNKCFFFTTSTSTFKDDKNNKISTIIIKDLYDLNENKQYGSFTRHSSLGAPMECRVLEKRCNSEAEWDALVKRYMEE